LVIRREYPCRTTTPATPIQKGKPEIRDRKDLRGRPVFRGPKVPRDLRVKKATKVVRETLVPTVREGLPDPKVAKELKAFGGILDPGGTREIRGPKG
jgi:hypothetical protein